MQNMSVLACFFYFTKSYTYVFKMKSFCNKKILHWAKKISHETKKNFAQNLLEIALART